jgi:cytochrome P450
VIGAKAGLVAYIADAVAERRVAPRDDFISRILQRQVDGRPLTDFEAENLLATVMSGGLDTVASMMCFAFLYLARHPARHPDARQTLRERPDLIVNAADELIRRHGLVASARVLTRDIDLHGAAMKADEQIILPNAFVGLDEDLFPDAWTVDIGRKGAGRHAAFGNGPHRCPGANLARLEIRLTIEEWLARIPDFALDPEGSPMFGSGIVGTVNALPLVWPG